MNCKRTAGESYSSCCRQASKRRELDMQLLFKQRRLDDSSNSETESRTSDGRASEGIDSSPENIGATASIPAGRNYRNMYDCGKFASEIFSSEHACIDSKYERNYDTASCADSTDQPSLTEQLAVWAREYNISGAAVTRLLHILKRYHPSLPNDARSLQRTCRKFNDDNTRLILRKLNVIDEKLDMMLNKLQHMTKNSTDTVDDTLPEDVILPLDSVRGVIELDNKLLQEPDTKRKLVSELCIY